MAITINTRKSAAIEEWARKEYGSWEDHNEDTNHVYSLLQKFGGNITLTIDQAKTIIKSGEYHSTAWDDDEIEGGAKTKATIARYVSKLKSALQQL